MLGKGIRRMTYTGGKVSLHMVLVLIALCEILLVGLTSFETRLVMLGHGEAGESKEGDDGLDEMHFG